MSGEPHDKLKDVASGPLKQALASASDDAPTPAELDAIARGLPLGAPVVAATAVLPKAVVLLATLAVVGVTWWVRRPVLPPVVPSTPPPVLELDVEPPSPGADAPPPMPAPAAPVGPPTTAPPALLGPSELETVSAADSALRRGDAAEALKWAEAARKMFPQGTLVQEREVVAIEALVLLGRRLEAETRFEAFVAAFPASGHLPRLKAKLEGTKR